jgi:hypothetical protein
MKTSIPTGILIHGGNGWKCKGSGCLKVPVLAALQEFPIPHLDSPVAVYVGGLDDSIFWPTEELHAVQLKRRNDIAQQMLKRPPPQGY